MVTKLLMIIFFGAIMSFTSCAKSVEVKKIDPTIPDILKNDSGK